MLLTSQEAENLAIETSRIIENQNYNSHVFGVLIQKMVLKSVNQKKYSNLQDSQKEEIHFDAIIKVLGSVRKYKFSKYSNAVKERFGNDRKINHSKGIYAFIDLLIKSSILDTLIKQSRMKRKDDYIVNQPNRYEYDTNNIADHQTLDDQQITEDAIDEHFAQKQAKGM